MVIGLRPERVFRSKGTKTLMKYVNGFMKVNSQTTKMLFLTANFALFLKGMKLF